MRPGTLITARDTPAPRASAPTDTGGWFVTGLAEQGPITPQRVTSLQRFKRVYGNRVSYSVLYDSLDAFFTEGGSVAYVARVQGPAPVRATGSLYDQLGSAVGDVALSVAAKYAGDYYNNLRVQVTGTGPYTITVSHVTDGTLETSPSLADRAAAVTWSALSSWVDIALGVSNELPRAQGPTALTGGTDDRASVTETQWTAALTQFAATLGPGQVSAPGRSTTAAYSALLAHAEAYNRVALLDSADVTSADRSSLIASAAALQALGAGVRYGGLHAPWVNIAGLVASTTRAVPASAVKAGLIARNDAVNDPGQAADGVNGRSAAAISVRAAFTDDDYEALNAGAVNLFRAFPQYGGEVRAYGDRSLADKDTYPLYWQLPWARLFMAVRAQGQDIAEHYVFSQVDGRGHTLAAYAGELTGMLLELYNADAFYGDSPAEAFNVNVGSAVNTIGDIADGNIRAVISVRMSPFSELVRLEITRRSITESVV